MNYDEPLVTVSKDNRRTVRVSTREYVLARIDQSGGPDACWPWTGHLQKKGYGFCTSRRRRDSTGSQLAHRISYEIAHGPIPAGLLILHRCDNRPCCNPAHLYAGTSAQNTDDMVRRGRGVAPTGLSNGRAKVSDERVRDIHRLHAQGFSRREIAAQVGLSHGYVGLIVRGIARPSALLADDGSRIPCAPREASA